MALVERPWPRKAVLDPDAPSFPIPDFRYQVDCKYGMITDLHFFTDRYSSVFRCRPKLTDTDLPEEDIFFVTKTCAEVLELMRDPIPGTDLMQLRLRADPPETAELECHDPRRRLLSH